MVKEESLFSLWRIQAIRRGVRGGLTGCHQHSPNGRRAGGGEVRYDRAVRGFCQKSGGLRREVDGGRAYKKEIGVLKTQCTASQGLWNREALQAITVPAWKESEREAKFGRGGVGGGTRVGSRSVVSRP